jgi:hypothetical protein
MLRLIRNRPPALTPRWLVWAAACAVTTTTLAASAADGKAESAGSPASGAASETTGGAQSSPASEADLAKARLLFSNGVELLQASPPNYQDAFPQFLAAYEKSGRSWKVLGNLGLCALQLERDGEALTYYRRYLDEGGDGIDAEERKAIEKELLLVEGNLAQVSVSSPEQGVRIKVSRQGSTAPTQVYGLAGEGMTLGLRAGTLTLTAEAGSKTQTWEVVLSPGQKTEHVFDFAEPAPTGDAARGTPARVADSAPGTSPVRLSGFVTAGVGVAALIGGGVTGFLSKQSEDDARAQCNGNVCALAAREDFDRADSLATLTNVLLIGGGVLAATGVTLIVLGGDSEVSGPAQTARVFLTPTVLPQGGGLGATGTF